MIRLSVSHLDMWVGFLEPALPQFEISTEQFIAKLRKQVPPTPAMKAGTALHSLLEHAKPGAEWGSVEGVEYAGYRFYFDMDEQLELPVVREPEVIEKVFDTSVGPVVLRGRIDGEDRVKRIIDYKLTEKLDVERYGSSLQWPAYLLMKQRQRFRYIVFDAKVNGKKREVHINAIHNLDFWAYDGMEREVHRRVEELADFVSRAMPGELLDHRDPSAVR
jgi:hypothetical protein